MTRAVIAVGVFAVVLVLVAAAIGIRFLETVGDPPGLAEGHPGNLFGRIITVDGTTYEGRLRWGGAEEAFCSHFFNGTKDENPWAEHVSPEQLTVRSPRKILGIGLGQQESEIDLGRPFMARFGDITSIDAHGADLRVTLKSGTVVDLDRMAADDFADGVRVWDNTHGVVDLAELRIRTVELLPGAERGDVIAPLHGTVQTPQGEFTGFLQWNREKSLGLDTLDGVTEEGKLSLRFHAIRSIARRSADSSLVTLLDGREIVLFGTREAGDGHRGIYVDDRRYGRVLISWGAFERVEFSLGGSGPDYDDFPPGGPLMGSVTTRTGDRFTGRLVYDLDESETTETLDAPFEGVDYTIFFGLIASIVPSGHDESDAQHVRVSLHNGEELQLERTGDLGENNAGLLIFVEGGGRAEYVTWTDVEQVDFDRPQAMYPPLDER